MLSSETTESSPIAYTQFLHWRRSLHHVPMDSALSTPPPQSATDGKPISWLTIHICYGLLTCSPPWRTRRRFPFAGWGFYFGAFSRVDHSSRCPIWLQ